MVAKESKRGRGVRDGSTVVTPVRVAPTRARRSGCAVPLGRDDTSRNEAEKVEIPPLANGPNPFGKAGGDSSSLYPSAVLTHLHHQHSAGGNHS